MRIELPLPSWAEAQRVHDDAHTLTVPPQLPQAVPLLGAAGAQSAPGDLARVQVAGAYAPLTLTL